MIAPNAKMIDGLTPDPFEVSAWGELLIRIPRAPLSVRVSSLVLDIQKTCPNSKVDLSKVDILLDRLSRRGCFVIQRDNGVCLSPASWRKIQPEAEAYFARAYPDAAPATPGRGDRAAAGEGVWDA